MTEREAIALIGYHREYMYGKDCQNLCQALEMAENVLEKQIPKKPIFVEEVYPTHDWVKDENGDVDMYAFEFEYHMGIVCHRCGQSYCTMCNEGRIDDIIEHEQCDNSHYICPSCEKRVYHAKRCENCGQVLDWESEAKND